MREIFRYQVGCAGHYNEDRPALDVLSFTDQYFQDLGTYPEMTITDTKTGKLVSHEKIEKITGVPKAFWNDLCNRRMYINCLYGDLQRMQREIRFVY